MIVRTRRTAFFVLAMALGHITANGYVAQAAPSNSTTLRAVQNSTGATAIIIVVSETYAKDSIVVTSSSLQGKSSSKTFIIGSASVGKNRTVVVTSEIRLPKQSIISVFSGLNHLMTVVDIPIPKVTTLPKSSKAVAPSKSTSRKILQAAADRWFIEFNKSKNQVVTAAQGDPNALRDAVDSATAALNAYTVAGGDVKNQLVVNLISATNASPQVLADITTATNAIRAATTRLPSLFDSVALREARDFAIKSLNAYLAAGGSNQDEVVVSLLRSMKDFPQVLAEITTATNAIREATTRLPGPPDPVALREAGDFAIKSLNAYLAAGGSNENELVVSLLGAMKAFPPVLSDITTAANAIREATTKLPPRVDPRQAAIEEVLRGLVVKAEALLDYYFASGGSGEDDVALALLRALNADPQNSSEIVEAMNALSFARTQLPTPDNLDEVLGAEDSSSTQPSK